MFSNRLESSRWDSKVCLTLSMAQIPQRCATCTLSASVVLLLRCRGDAGIWMVIESWTAEINKIVLMELPAIKGMFLSVSFIPSLAGLSPPGLKYFSRHFVKLQTSRRCTRNAPQRSEHNGVRLAKASRKMNVKAISKKKFCCCLGR